MVLACVAGAKREGERRNEQKRGNGPLPSIPNTPSVFPTQAIVVPPSLLNESS